MATNHEEKIVVFDRALKALGLDYGMKTDPRLIREVLAEMRLLDLNTSFGPIDKFLSEIKSTPHELNPIFNNIKKAITDKHPAIIDFLEIALSKEWLNGSVHVTKAVHVLYVLEHVTAAMCNNHTFFCEVHDHLKVKEKLYGIDLKHLFRSFLGALKITRSLFETIKAFSVDPAVTYLRYADKLCKASYKEVFRDMRNRKEINFIEYKILSKKIESGFLQILGLLRLNIYEAGITEFEEGFKNNSVTAFELNEDIMKHRPKIEFANGMIAPENTRSGFYDSLESKENIILSCHLSQKFFGLYTSWNMAFVLGTLDNLDIVLPKLLIPSFIDTKAENALEVRIVSLWLIINTFFFRKADGTPDILGPNNKKEMALAWGEINKKYAISLANRETHEDSRTLMRHYRQFFSRPISNFLRLLDNFLF